MENAMEAFGEILNITVKKSAVVEVNEGDEDIRTEEESIDENNETGESDEAALTSDEDNRNHVINEITEDVVFSFGEEFVGTLTGRCQIENEDSFAMMLLPAECCQSRLGNANGSNACVLISLVFGNVVLKKQPTLFENFLDPRFSTTILPFLCGAIETGNIIYDHAGISGFLYVTEAIEILPENFSLSVIFERDFFPQPNGENSLGVFLDELATYPDNTFCVLVTSGYAHTCLYRNDKIFVVDSHANGDFGGKVCMYANNNYKKLIDDFIINTEATIYVCIIAVN